jgi:hypothetical protein
MSLLVLKRNKNLNSDLITSYKREKLYKDLFTHDLKDILQNFQQLIDVISLNISSQDLEIESQ